MCDSLVKIFSFETVGMFGQNILFEGVNLGSGIYDLQFLLFTFYRQNYKSIKKMHVRLINNGIN